MTFETRIAAGDIDRRRAWVQVLWFVLSYKDLRYPPVLYSTVVSGVAVGPHWVRLELRQIGGWR